MKLHAKFPTQLRGQDLEVELSGDFDPPVVEIEVQFFKGNVKVALEPALTRTELAALFREAGRRASVSVKRSSS